MAAKVQRPRSVIQIRLPENEKRVLQALAKANGVSLSEMIRVACRSYAQPKLVCPQCGSDSNMLTDKNDKPVKCTACEWTMIGSPQ